MDASRRRNAHVGSAATAAAAIPSNSAEIFGGSAT